MATTNKLTPIHGYRTTESSPYNLAMTEADYLIDGLMGQGESSGAFGLGDGVTWGVGFSEATGVYYFEFYFRHITYVGVNENSEVESWFSTYLPSITKVFTSEDNTDSSWTEVKSFNKSDSYSPWEPVAHYALDGDLVSDGYGGWIQYKIARFRLNLGEIISSKYFKIKFLIGAGTTAQVWDGLYSNDVYLIWEIEVYNADVSASGSINITGTISPLGTGSRYPVGNGNLDIDIGINSNGLTGIIGSGNVYIYDILISSLGGGYGNVTLEVSSLGIGSSDFLGNGAISIYTDYSGMCTVGVVGSGGVEIDFSIASVGSGPISGDGAIEFTINKISGRAVGGNSTLGEVLRYDDRWLVDSAGDGEVEIELIVNGE